MTISIGPLQPEEVPAFCTLFQRVFSVHITPEWRHWKYLQGPRSGHVSLVARDATGALLGHVGALVFPGMAQGRVLPMAQVCDVMVDPTARGGVDHGGTYARLMAELQRTLARQHPGVFAYGFAGVRPYKLGARMGLYRAVQACRMGVLEFQPGRQLSREKTEGPQRLQAPRVWPLFGQPPWAWVTQPVGWNHPALGALWQRVGPASIGPLVQRTPAYLRWRYASHPQHRYQAWLLRRWGRAQGWVATRLQPDGTLCMVDRLLPPSLPVAQAAHALAQAVHQQGDLRALQLSSWDIATEASARLEPIMGCEVLVDRWHSDPPTSNAQPGLASGLQPDLTEQRQSGVQLGFQPRFQPGDTDVF